MKLLGRTGLGHIIVLALHLHCSLALSTRLDFISVKQCDLEDSKLCKNLSTSKQCSATRHCIQSDWESRSVPVDNSPTCQICKNMIKESRNMLPCANREVELWKIFETTCKMIPSKHANEECIKIVINSFNEYLELLSSQMSYEQTCTVMKLCNDDVEEESFLQDSQGDLDERSSTDEVNLEIVVQRMEADNVPKKEQLSCRTCKNLALTVQQNFNSNNRENLVEQLLNSCYSLDNKLSEACSYVVVNYFDDIYELWRQQFESNDICHSAGICTYFSNEQTIENPNEFYCAECEKFLKTIQLFLKKQFSEKYFKQKLEGICKLTRKFKGECLSTVDELYHIIYKTIVIDLNAHSICSFAGICKKKNVFPIDLFGSDTQLTPQPLESNEKVPTPQCLACKTAFRVVKKMVSQKVSNEKLKNAMNRACNKLGKLSHKCHDVINKHGDQLIRLARSPRVMCTMVGMCFGIDYESDDSMDLYEIETDDKEYSDLRSQNSILDIENDSIDMYSKGLPKCSVCKTAIKTLKHMIHHTDKNEIKNALSHVCHKLPKMKHICEDMVNKHADQIVDLIVKHAPPQMICKAIGMCH